MTANVVSKLQKAITEENIDPWEDDLLERREFGRKLKEALEKFSFMAGDDAYVVSLNAPFGSGKTHFLKCWQAWLEEKEQGFQTVYIDAWKTDFAENPIVPLISDIIHAIEDKADQETIDNLKEGMARYSKGSLSAVYSVVTQLGAAATGVDIDKVIADTEEGQKSEEKKFQERGERLYDQYHYMCDALDKIQKTLNKYASNLEKPLIVIVDELDRARPNYAIEFLETIKHVFAVKNVCFVIGVDRDQLESSAKQMFGNGLIFGDYYRKFVAFEAQLPTPKEIHGLVRRFYERIFDDIQSVDKREFSDISDMLRDMGLQPRNIDHFFKCFSVGVDRANSYPDYWKQIIPAFLVASKIKFNKEYISIIKGNYTVDEFYRFISKFKFADKEFLYIMLAAYGDDSNKQDIIDFIRSNIDDKKSHEDIHNDFYAKGLWYLSTPQKESYFKKVADRIDNLSSFF